MLCFRAAKIVACMARIQIPADYITATQSLPLPCRFVAGKEANTPNLHFKHAEFAFQIITVR